MGEGGGAHLPREKGKRPADKREKGGTETFAPFPLCKQSARTHARTKRNDFPVGLSPNLRYIYIYIYIYYIYIYGWVYFVWVVSVLRHRHQGTFSETSSIMHWPNRWQRCMPQHMILTGKDRDLSHDNVSRKTKALADSLVKHKSPHIFTSRSRSTYMYLFGIAGNLCLRLSPTTQTKFVESILSKIVQTFVPGKVRTSSCNEKFTPPLATKCPHSESPQKIHTPRRHEKSIDSAATKSPHT